MQWHWGDELCFEKVGDVRQKSCMTTTLTIRLPAELAREFKAKAANTTLVRCCVEQRLNMSAKRTHRSGQTFFRSISVLAPGAGMATVPGKSCCGERGHDSLELLLLHFWYKDPFWKI